MKSIVDYTNELKDFFASKQALTTKADITDITTSSLIFTGTATTAVSKGRYFYNNGVLRKATTAISNGASITDSNSTVVTVGAELTALNNRFAWKGAGFFKENGTITLNYNLQDYDELMFYIFLGRPRLTMLIAPMQNFINTHVDPDCMTVDGRVYFKATYVDDTHITISDLTGLSDYSSSAYIYFAIR